MTGYNKIKPKRVVKKYASGGDVSDDNMINGVSNQALMKGADFLSDSLSIFNQPGKANVGIGTAQGALKGAALGTSILPGIGTGVGAVIGGATSLFTGLANKKAIDAETLQKQKDDYNQQLNRSNATLTNYNTTGTVNNQFYAKGGKIMPKYKMMADGGDPKPKATVMIGPKTGIEIPSTGNVDLGYSRVYGSQKNIPNNNIEALRTQYRNDPSVMNILNRNIAPVGEVPMYSAQDGDNIRTILGKYQSKPQAVAANITSYASGGFIANPDYEAEKGEVVQGNPQLEESNELASDMHKVGGDTHEQGGTMGIGGDRVFSDRLKISPVLSIQLKSMKIPVKSNSTYADVSTKLGNMKGKFEDKLDSTFTPNVNTGKKMLGTINNTIDQIFNDQELQKKVIPNNVKNMNLAYGGKIPKYTIGGTLPDDDVTGLNSLPSQYTTMPIDNTLPTNPLNPLIHDISTMPKELSMYHNTPTNDGESILSRIGKGIDENSGQLTNAGAYIANLGSINKLDTSVKRNYLTPPTYNYTNRSGQAIYDNNKTFNTATKALTGSSAGVNAANIGALYASTLEANNKINSTENNRKDSYDSAYNDRADKVNMINAEMGNSAKDIARDLTNNKRVALPISARNAFLQGVMGNNQVKANNKAQQTQMKIAALLFDKNNVLSRYGDKLKAAGLNIGDN